MLTLTGLDLYTTAWPFVIIVVLTIGIAVWTWFVDDDWVTTTIAFFATLILSFLAFAAVFSISVSSQERRHLNNQGYIIVDEESGVYDVIGPDGERRVVDFQPTDLDLTYRVVVR